MRSVPRRARSTVERAARAFAAVVLTGPRRAGKTYLLRRLFPHARYVLLEDPDVLLRVRADPHGFLDELTLPVILDEIQNAPELLSYIRTRIDAHPRRTGLWLLTGSHEATLIHGVTESLAGRAAILQLLPLSRSETTRVSLLNGGYPEVLARPRARDLWFSSYLQTYLERDVRAITNVRDLGTFRRFIGLVAARHGQVLNKSDLASPLGVSVPTIGEWLHVLEVTAQVLLIPPYFENFGKRLIKSPKIFLSDSGLACHLLGIRTAAELERSPFLGAIVEGFVAAEIAKAQVNAGQRRELYFFRDRPGFEIDLMVPHAGKLWAIEVKSSHTVRPADGAALAAIKPRRPQAMERWVVHRAPQRGTVTNALLPNVGAISIEGLVEKLNDY
jgi:predicted AAA+ superfamily ATPase